MCRFYSVVGIASTSLALPRGVAGGVFVSVYILLGLRSALLLNGNISIALESAVNEIT